MNKSEYRMICQVWLGHISMMQQSVLLSAIRGPDGVAKYGPAKMLLRWLRRCILVSAMDGKVLSDPYDLSGGSFTGPSLVRQDSAEDWRVKMHELVGEYLKIADAMPHHYHTHLMHAVQILGYKHPDHAIQRFWLEVYHRFVTDMHLAPESKSDMNHRLGDDRDHWLEHNDPATSA